MRNMVKVNDTDIKRATQGWLLLTFFMCLHKQLSSFNSIVVQTSEKRDSSNRQLK